MTDEIPDWQGLYSTTHRLLVGAQTRNCELSDTVRALAADREAWMDAATKAVSERDNAIDERDHTVDMVQRAGALVLDLANALDRTHGPCFDGDACDACVVLERARTWAR